MKRSFIAYAVSLVALSASLGGCNGGGDPTPSPTVTSSSPGASPTVSASPSASPSPSVSIPAEAMQQTPEGAVAFVKFYVDQINLAWTTPDSTLLPRLTTTACNSCASFQSDAEEYASQARKLSAAPLSTDNVSARDGGLAGAQLVAANVVEVAVPIIDVAGNQVDTGKQSSGSYVFALVWEEGQWRVNGVVAE